MLAILEQEIEAEGCGSEATEGCDRAADDEEGGRRVLEAEGRLCKGLGALERRERVVGGDGSICIGILMVILLL